jgi:hypothetical protein
MDTLVKIIEKTNKYPIRSANNDVIILFEQHGNKFGIESINDPIINRWMGVWIAHNNSLHLTYYYEKCGLTQLKPIHDLKQAKISYEAGPHILCDGSTHKDKWIFDKEIFHGTNCTIFYSMN